MKLLLRLNLQLNTDIDLLVTGTPGEIIAGTIPTSITIPANSTSVILAIQTLSDVEINENKIVSVVLNQSSSYQLGENSTAIVAVTETTPASEQETEVEISTVDPIISIQLVTEGELIEGAIAEFRVSASEAPTENLNIRIDVNEGATDFFDLSEFIPVTLLAGETFISIQIASIDDEVAETEGEIILRLGEGEGYQIGEQNQIAIYMNDDEGGLTSEIATETPTETVPTGPELTISSLNEEPIEEGGIAQFKIDASTPPEADLEISVIVGEGGLSYFEIAEIIPVTLASGETSVEFTLESTDDEVDEADDVFELSIGPGVGYQIGEPFSASVSMLDNDDAEVTELEIAETPVVTESDSTPIISIALSTDAEISEGSSGGVLITANQELADDLLITVSIANETGNYATSGNQTTSIEAGANSASLNVETIDDETWDVDGTVLVSLVDSEFYQISEPNSVSITVLDNDAPELLTQAEPSFAQSQVAQPLEISAIPEVSISSVVESVIEGESAVFTLVATESVEELIAIDVSFTGDFQPLSDVPITVDMTGETNFQFEIPTLDDEEFEENGAVNVTVLTGTSYLAAGEPDNSATVTIENNDVISIAVDTEAALDVPVQELPELTISALDTEPVFEGDFVIFQLNSTVIPEVDFSVNIQISDVDDGFSGDFIDETGYSSLIFRAFDNRMIFDVPIEEDETDELDGRISMEIFPGENYLVGDPSIAYAEILDNDEQGVPEIFITSVPAIETGKNAEFRIISNKVLQSTISVNVRVSGQGLLWPTTVIPVQVLTGETEARLFVPTDANVSENQAIFVSAEILDGQGYILSESQTTVTIELQEEIEPNYITVSAVDDTVDEGFPATFRISSTVSQPAPLNIWVDTRAQNSGLAPRSEVRSLSLPAGAREMFINVDTEINDFNDQDGIVVVNILSGADYEVGNFPADSAEVTVINNVVPVISIRSASLSGNEGDVFEFSVTARPVPQSNIGVNLNVSETSSFLSRSGTERVVLGQNERSVQFTLETVDDNQTESDGQISVEILPGEDYKVATGNGAVATSDVSDNDAPRLAISFVGGAAESTITEGGNLELELSSSSLVATDLVVNLGIEEMNGDYLSGDPEIVGIIPANQNTGPIVIPTVDDEADEDDGLFVVTLLPGDGYNLVEGSVTATANLIDNDEGREIAIFAVSETITEGDEAIFNLNASGPMYRSVDLLVVSGGGDFLTDEVPLSVFFENQNEAIFVVPTLDDDVDEVHGDISVSIIATDNYTLGEENTLASVPVLDNDDSPTVSIVATQTDHIIEGDSALFDIVATRGANRVINISISDGESDFLIDGDTTLEVDLGGQSQASLELLTKTTEIQEEDSVIVATILPGIGYDIAESPANTAMTVILDSLSDRVDFGDLIAEIGAATGVVSDDLPIIELISSLKSVVEGNNVGFSVRSQYPVAESISVKIEITDGDEIRGRPDYRTVTILAGSNISNEVYFNVEINDTYSFDRRIIAEIVEDAEFEIADSGNVVEIIVTGDSTPEVSIETLELELDPDSGLEVANFRINASFALTRDLPITVNVLNRLVNESINESNFVDSFDVNLLANEDFVTFGVENGDDFASGNQIVVDIVAGSGYILSPDPNKRSASVSVDESEYIISISATQSEIVEGNNAEFTISSSRAVSNPLEISIEVTESSDTNPVGDFIDESAVQNTITIPENASEATLTIPTVGDEVFEGGSQIAVEVVDTDDYELASELGARSASISVVDNDTPVISIIAASTGPIDEGVDAQYRITSSVSVPFPLVVNYSVSDGDSSDFVEDSASNSITLPANETVVTLNIETVDDDIVEASGEIVVRLLPGTIYTIAPADSAQFATVSINDNEIIPVVTILRNAESIEEGDVAEFYVTTTPPVEREFSVKFGYNQRALNDFIAGTPVLSTEFVTLQTEKVLFVPTLDDTVAETNGEIIVSIIEDINYTLNQDVSRQSATIPVISDDVPVISVSGEGDIIEGQNATFSISSDIELSDTWVLDVRYSLAGGDNFIASGEEKIGSVSFGPILAEETQSIEFSTEDDNTVEDDELGLTLSILPSGVDTLVSQVTYDLGPNSSDTLAIRDNDNNANISVTASHSVVMEGEIVTYTIVADERKDPSKDLEIRFMLEDVTGNFLSTELRGENKIVLEDQIGEVSNVVHVTIVENDIDQADGRIRFKLLPYQASQGVNTEAYDVSDTEGSVETGVQDNDIPEISVSAVDNNITEGSTAEFTFSSDIERQNIALTINFGVTGSTFFAPSQSANDSIILPAGDTDVTVTKSIQTIDDEEIDTGDGTVTITITNSSSNFGQPPKYSVSSEDDVGVVEVFDNDTKPTIKITAGDPVTEGSDAVFTVVSNQRLGEDIGFGYSFTEGNNNFIASTVTNRTGTVYIREGLSDGQTQIIPGIIEIDTDDDRVDEANGTITVYLYPLNPVITEYQLDPNNKFATVTVIDNDVPEISVTTDGFSVAEGRDAVFTFSSNIARSTGRAITINFSVSGTNNYLHSSQSASDSIVLLAGESEVSKNIRTNDLSGSGPDGEITVTITAPSVSDSSDPITYTISSQNEQKSIRVVDNDRQAGRTEGYNDEFLFLEEIASAERSNAEGSFNAPIQEQNETGLPRVSISSPNERVKEGEVIYFVVSVDSPVSESIMVKIKVSEESGKFLRYTEREGPLIIEARSSRAVIKVETIDDIVFDGEETVTAEILDDNEKYEIESRNVEVTVFDIESEELSDRYSNVNDNVLPDLVQSISANLVDSISNRVASAGTIAGLEQVQFEVGGYNSLQDILQFKANEINDSANSWTRLLENSSFQLPLLSAAGDTIPVTVWGIGDYAQINESDPNSTVSQDGELYTAQLGFDARYENGLLTGVAISRFESELEYTNQVDNNNSTTEGIHQVQINSAQPYLAWAAEERVFEIWGSAGYGQGTIQLDELENDDKTNETTIDTNFYVTAIGASNRLFESNQIFGGEGELRLRGEVWSSAIGITNGPVGLNEGNYAAQRARFATEATHTYQFESESTLNSAVSAGVRWDNFLNDDEENLNEDDNSQLGFESASEFSYDVPVGVKFTFGGRMLVVPTSDAGSSPASNPASNPESIIEEWGLQSELQIDLGQDNLGPILYASPSWGDPQSGGIQGIWDSGLESDSTTRLADAQMVTELGYGLMTFDQNGILTPFIGATFKQYGLHEYSLGARFTAGSSFNFELSGSRRTIEIDDIEWESTIKANYNW